MHDGPVVLFAGGGTGGHLYPALALAEELERRRPDVRAFFVGAQGGLEAQVLPERGVDHELLPVRGLRRGQLWSNLGVPAALARSFARALVVHRRLRPELVVVTGGYAGAPAGLVAAMLRTPLVLQEQNAWPGVTTRILSRWGTQVHIAFPEALERLSKNGKRAARVTGSPIRPLPESPPDREETCRRLGLDPDRRVLLVIGGSQGSVALNDLVLGGLRDHYAPMGAEGDEDVSGDGGLLPEGWQLMWATGPNNFSSIQAALSEMGDPRRVRAVPYIEDVPLVLGVTELAVSRSGAMTTAELLAWGVPAILVPLPTSAADHQTLNALALQQAGAARYLSQDGLTPSALWSSVADLAHDQAELAAMSRAARERSRPEATSAIVTDLMTLLPEPRGVESA